MNKPMMIQCFFFSVLHAVLATQSMC
ncbi:rCG56771, isoform CRA_b [Rattus norvegicus]|uniref:RCG56771, isoform CRA_b n=1 Tax=Rattus norvegicus TaxID=10116 RepID=A6KJJ8_RAT|nr:rCG56771, isoform CRA_b [Rattus norvegicus]